jgi:hypothetical protein
MKFTLAALALLSAFPMAIAESVMVKGHVKVTNMAPDKGTCQTPVWVGIHDGTFDSYDGGSTVSTELERLAEDGDNGPIKDAFAALAGGVWDGVAGEAPICSTDDPAIVNFEIEIKPGEPYYFSYISMVLPSNDAFVANGDPAKHMLFDADGKFQALNFEVMGSEVNDAGSEVNDELPANTAFFGQMAPNTGEDEGGVVTAHPGFKASGSGGILDDPAFVNADFTADGYVMMSIKVVLDEMTTDSPTTTAPTKAPTKAPTMAPTMAPSDGTSPVFAGSILACLSSIMALGFAIW